jgi:type VI secretion system protein ImpF
MDRNALVFIIEGQLWARPYPQNLVLRTELDLETGTVTLDDSGR